MKATFLTTCAALLAQALTIQAEAVLEWNLIAQQKIFTALRQPPSATVDFAVVQAAVHDAVQAYDKQYEPYATEILGATGSPAAAVARAARDVLVNRFPAQAASIDADYAAYFDANGLAADDAGVDVGAAAAAGMIAMRADDGGFPDPAPIFIGEETVGLWRPTESFQAGPPASFSPMSAAWLGDCRPFVLLSSDQFQCDPPYPLESKKYARDYNEVKALGARFNSSRTAEQTHTAFIWAGNFFAQVTEIAHQLAEEHLDCSADRARFLALVWLTAADGAINTWDNKLVFPTWRPLTAIREGNNDGNPRTAGDPNWEPLINTPNYPEHSSGANALMAGTTGMMRLFFRRDRLNFTVTSSNPNAVPNWREYHRVSDLQKDVVDARVFQGIHFRLADTGGRQVGRKVAKWVFKHALRPLYDNCGDTDDEDEDEDERD